MLTSSKDFVAALPHQAAKKLETALNAECVSSHSEPAPEPLVTDMLPSLSATLEFQRMAAIVDGLDDAIISKTLDGTISTWNVGATRIFGYTALEMIGSPITRIIPAELQTEESEIVAKLARGERIDHFDTVRLAKDGRRVAVSLTVSPLRDAAGKVVGASKIARDISNRKESEEKLRSANEALRNANDVAQQLRLEAENASRAKTDFLAVMSHEIRTPLNSINGFIDLLTSATVLTPKQRRYADMVLNASAALLTIVDDILDLSKVEAGKMDLQQRPFSIRALIHELASVVTTAKNGKKLKLTFSIEPSVPDWALGDPGRLRQILLNLLSNAVKFSDGGTITLEVRQGNALDAPEQVYFSVKDTGIGISLEDQDRLFKPFSQADSSASRRHGGTGLGLAICKRLVQLMDGQIGMESIMGRGTIVWFTASLPNATQPAAQRERGSLGRKPGSKQIRVMVVDDIDANLEIVEAFLADGGYIVDCVSSGLEAIQLLGSEHFDMILMDVQMPIMDGLTATHRIRALPYPIRDIPIVAMTGNVLPQQIRKYLEAGMNDHIGKPIDRAGLYSGIDRWLPEGDASGSHQTSQPTKLDRFAFEAFALALGRDKALSIAERLVASLSGAFKSGLVETRREAHDLVNTAGVLGLSSLVAACRRVTERTSAQDPDGDRPSLQQLLRAQGDALQTLEGELLPRLRSVTSPPKSIQDASPSHFPMISEAECGDAQGHQRLDQAQERVSLAADDRC